MSVDGVRLLLYSGWTEAEIRDGAARNGWDHATVSEGIADFKRRAAEGAL